MSISTKAVGIARVPARPGLLARLRRPKPHELVQVAIAGHPRAVTAVTRALAAVTVVTGMRHHVQAETDEANPVIRIEVTCYPTERIADGAG
jgi:hypothetical protein